VPIARAMSTLFIINSLGNVIRLRQRRELDYAIPTQASFLSAIISGIVGVLMAL
jgi:hypothetical protein